MRPVRTALLALPLILSACASAPTAAIAPLEPLRLLQADLRVRPAARGLERPEFVPMSEQEAANPAPLVSIRARFLEIDRDVAERCFGERDSVLLAIVVMRERGEQMLSELERELPDFELVNETSLVLHQGQEGHVSVTQQRAFVSGFVLRTNGRGGLADPEIGVATQGSQLVAMGELDGTGEHVGLDLCLEDCRLDEVFAGIDVSLAGLDVQIQEPRGLIRSLSTQVSLAPDEALLIGGSSLAKPGEARALFVLVEAEACAADAAR